MSAQAWVTLVVGVLGFSGVIVSVLVTGAGARRSLAQQSKALEQRADADDRAEAWGRISWCLERIFGTNTREATLAADVLAEVSESRLITVSERGVLRAVMNRLSTEMAVEPVDGDTEGEEAKR